MLLKILSNIALRRFHNYKPSRLPAVKLANKRVSRAIKSRKDSEADSRVDSIKQFEPFPYVVNDENKVEYLRKSITPLYDVPYDEQLRSKDAFCRNSLRYFAQQLYKSGTPVRLDVKRLPCYVNNIVRSPEIERYRNSDELSIWRGLDENKLVVGYMLFPISKHGDTICVEPNGCGIMKEDSIKVANILQDFLNDQAKLPVSFTLGEEGGWRRFKVRTNVDNDIMLIGFLNPRQLKIQQIIDERNNFKEFILEKCQSAGLRLTSLYFQPCPNNFCRNDQVPFELIHGEPTIIETMGNYKIRLSPESHIHQNTSGAIALYRTMHEQLNETFGYNAENKVPLLIDVKCGAGALAINLSDIAQNVVGIDISDQAIEDCRANVILNKSNNVEFIRANVEISIERIMEKYHKFSSDTLVVCDVPRIGLHRIVAETLRHSQNVTKMLFVTAKPDDQRIIDNLITLCSKTSSKSLPPFAPVSATPVDIYPQTQQISLAIALERLPK